MGDLDLMSMILGVLLATGGFSVLIVRDAMRPRGRATGRREAP